MIIVLADDLTGAAELGGLALRYKLNVEITTKINPTSEADLLIIATDTRSLSRKQAESVITDISEHLISLKPTFLFKKIDSVLRGHVLAEINILKTRLNLKKALLVPANPELGRTIVDRTYLLNGRPVHLSSFSRDPEFPISTSDVSEILKSNDDPVYVLKPGELMPKEGIIVGEVKDRVDLASWCEKIEDHMLVAGAAEFFTALLLSLNMQPSSKISHSGAVQLPALMILGSSFHKKEFDGKEQQFPVNYIREALVDHGPGSLAGQRQWMEETVLNLEKHGKAIIAIDSEIKGKQADALFMRTLMAEGAAYISGKLCIREYLIEGGSTAAAVLRKLGIDTLYPVEELAPGVIRMQVEGRDGLYITIKPGSYEWPPSIRFNKEIKDEYKIDY